MIELIPIAPLVISTDISSSWCHKIDKLKQKDVYYSFGGSACQSTLISLYLSWF